MITQKNVSMEGYKELKADSEQSIKEYAQEYFPEGANLYAVLDYAVGFGRYESGEFYVGLGNHSDLEPLQWEYTRELRIFDEAGELWMKPDGEEWKGRFRGSLDRIKEERSRRQSRENGDIEAAEGAGVNERVNELANEKPEFYIDEPQKLWGQVKKGNRGGIPGWSLLTSDRGTQIQIPFQLPAPEENEVRSQVGAAILVRRYMRIPVTDKQEMVYQTDVRMMGFDLWEHNK